MFQALFYSSSVGTVRIAIGIFYVYYVGWLLQSADIIRTKYTNCTVHTVPPDDAQISAGNK
jgi:hypothetical protein